MTDEAYDTQPEQRSDAIGEAVADGIAPAETPPTENDEPTPSAGDGPSVEELEARIVELEAENGELRAAVVEAEFEAAGGHPSGQDAQGNFTIPTVSRYEAQQQAAAVAGWERTTGLSIDEPNPEPETEYQYDTGGSELTV